MKKPVILLLLFLVSLASPAQDTLSPPTGTLYQVALIDSLLSGVYDGDTTIRELKQHGDFGLGTFNRLDGEMLAIDGRYYQIKADGVAYPAANAEKTPFAMVTFFEEAQAWPLGSEMDFAGLEKWLDERLLNKNLFYAIRIDGTFKQMKTRAVPAQEKPYRPLAEVVKTQPTFEFTNVKGVMVGFRSPAFAKGVNVPGYHLHFLTADGKAGGHVLSFSVADATVKLGKATNFLLHLPEDEAFSHSDLAADREKELLKVEK